MDVKEYIQSGILEEYNLGSLNDQEKREVECMSKIYPEIREALNAIEEDLESFARTYAKKPPASVRNQILAAVKKETPDQKVLQLSKDDKKEEVRSEVVKSKSSASLTWLAAAAILGFAFAVWQFYEGQNKAVEIATLRSENNKIQSEYQSLEMQFAELNEGMEEMYDPMLQKVVMNPVMEGVESKVSVFWNKKNGQVKLDPSTLPEIAENEQYQLWVIRDGKPVDMGILPKDQTGALMASQKTLTGEAFALTIEPLGGREQPTMEKMVVMAPVA